jgi:hypothetical protein
VAAAPKEKPFIPAASAHWRKSMRLGHWALTRRRCASV